MLTLHKRHFVALLALVLTFVGIAFVQAWTGPTAAPPNNNVDAPVNVGSGSQVKSGGLSVDFFTVFGNTLLSGLGSGAGRYLNFDYTPGGTSGVGESGYGIRDNAGTMEVKDENGIWARLATTTAAGAFQQIKFSDGTTQTTAGGGVSSGTVGGGCFGKTEQQQGEGEPPPPVPSGWGNAIDCNTTSACNDVTIVGSCPAEYTARRIGTGAIDCAGGTYNNCGCGSHYVYGQGTVYYPSYSSAPMLCIKD